MELKMFVVFLLQMKAYRH